MRFMICEQIWHSFEVLHRHLLLMMDFDYPLAFRHKKTYEMFLGILVLVSVFRGRVYFLIGWSLWSCLDCI